MPALTGLALRSLAHRRTAFAATFLSIVLATALIGSFAILFEAGLDASGADQETLVIMGAVVGSWGAVIALFSLASTVGLTIRHRDAEVGLLRVVGATPAQVRRLVRRETLVVSLVGVLVGGALALAGGRALLALIREGGLIGTVDTTGGFVGVGVTAFALVMVAQVAAFIAGRRATRAPVRLVLVDAATGVSTMRWWRVAAGLLLVAYGVAAGILTVTVMRDSDDPYAPMQTSGSAGIIVSVGLALLAPALLRRGAHVLRPTLGRGAAAMLATEGAARRPGALAGVLGPVVVFVATTVGTYLMVGIDGRTLDAIAPDAQEADTITLLNYVVTGMIAVFAAIMVVNALVAATSVRGAEFRRLRLAGAEPGQVRRLVHTEGVLVTILGVVLGCLAAAATAVPYAVARDEGLLPDGQLWVIAVAAGLALVLLVGTGAVATRRTLAADAPTHAGRQAVAA